MSDNVGLYRALLFRPPGPRTLAAYLTVIGIVFGAASVFMLSPSSSLRVNLAGAAIAAIFFYLLPAFLSAEITGRLGDVSRTWTYLMSAADVFILFFFSLTVPFTDSSAEAWQVMWLALATVYLVNLTMVLMARGRQKLHWNLLYPLIYPVAVLASFHVFIGRLVGIPKILYLQNSLFFLLSAFLLLLTLANYTFLMKANVDMSFFDFFPPLILGEKKALDGGVTTDIHHQALSVDNGETLRFNIPWLHPGPVDGFGGGRLTSELIDAETFMLHIPSYHTLDLADPDDIGRFTEMPGASTAGRASRMLTLEKDGFTLWGRRYEGGSVVYIQNRNIDDYEPSIAYDLKEEHPDLCLVDLHNQTLSDNAQKWLQHMDHDARVLEQAVGEMVEMLEDAEMEEYRAGFAGGAAYRCLVEEVGARTNTQGEFVTRTPSPEGDGVQRTCLLGVNASDAPPVLQEAGDDIPFDHSLVFTTDSHEDLLTMAAPDYGRAELEEAVEDAEEDLSKAEAGLGEQVVEDVRVLGKDYEGLITTLNVMARLVPITLVLYYVGIVFLIL